LQILCVKFFSELPIQIHIFASYFENKVGLLLNAFIALLIYICCILPSEMKSRRHNHHKQILSVTSAFVLTAGLMMVVMTGGGVMPTMTAQQVFAQTVEESLQGGYGQQPDNATTTIAGSATNATTATMTNATTVAGEVAPIIKMMPTEVNGTYRWATNDTINPTITLVANVNNTITVNNPTDEVHELVIAMAQGGAEVASTGDIPPNGHGELSIMPNATESLQYHCEYHPQTMLGDIRITNATTTMTNATTMTNQTQ
jgi:hypothetical protein